MDLTIFISSYTKLIIYNTHDEFDIYIYIFFFFFFWETNTHMREGNGFWHKCTLQLYSKAKAIFKGRWTKLYYTQHTLLSNVRQLPILIF